MQMKKVMRKFIFAITMLTLVCIATVVCAENIEPVITITFDKECVNVGETLTATYEITGLDDDVEVCASWTHWNRDSTISPYGEDLQSDQKKDSLSITPIFGTGLSCHVSVDTADGRWFSHTSEMIPIFGDNTIPPTITVTFDKESVNVGETLTATYEITGLDGDVEVHVSWTHWNRDSGISPYGEDLQSNQKKDSLSITPIFGTGLSCHVSVDTADGRWFSYTSEIVPIFGDNTIPPTITVTFDKESVNVGETLTATYEITGLDSDVEVYASWTHLNQNSGISPYGEELESNRKKDSLSITPIFGTGLSCHVSVDTADGRWFSYTSEIIPITGTPTVSYSIVPVAGFAYYQSGQPLQFKLDADFSKFRTILIDDQPVPSEAYTAWSGSTYVELKSDYLATLAEGEHTLSVLFSDGYGQIVFSTQGALSLPRTGDTQPIGLWMFLMCAGLIGIGVVSKRQKSKFM